MKPQPDPRIQQSESSPEMPEKPRLTLPKSEKMHPSRTSKVSISLSWQAEHGPAAAPCTQQAEVAQVAPCTNLSESP